MAYVYRYIDRDDGICKYIGIVYAKSHSLYNRIKQHYLYDDWVKSSKLGWDIEYIDNHNIANRTDAEYFEAHLISLYHTDKYFNVSKENWGISNYLPTEINWKPFDYEVDYNWLSDCITPIIIEQCKNIDDVEGYYAGKNISQIFGFSQKQLFAFCCKNNISYHSIERHSFVSKNEFDNWINNLKEKYFYLRRYYDNGLTYDFLAKAYSAYDVFDQIDNWEVSSGLFSNYPELGSEGELEEINFEEFKQLLVISNPEPICERNKIFSAYKIKPSRE